MAKVKITGHASGSGVFTITAPNSNTDRTITLPDASVTLGTDATKLPLAGGALTGALTTNSTIDGRDVAADGVLATNALPKAGGTITGALAANATITLGTNAYFIGANTTNAYTFNSVGDAANLFIIKNDGRAHSDFTARAWCNFSGSGTPSFWGSAVHNVSSLTDVGVGNWKVNFTNAMANTNYLAVGSGQGGLNCNPDGWATTYVTLNLRVEATNASTDGGHVGVVVFTEA